MVDLAGSERSLKAAGRCSERFEEAKNINKSLHSLGQVISALTDGKSQHIPYRNSTLTRLLQESLGGNSKTALILNCSSDPSDIEETVNTLKFGERAKRIENKAVINAEPSRLDLLIEMEKFKLKAERLERRVALLESFIQASKLAVPMASQVDSRRQSERFRHAMEASSETVAVETVAEDSEEEDGEEQEAAETATIKPTDPLTTELLETLVLEYEEQVDCAHKLEKIQAELQMIRRLRSEDMVRVDALLQLQSDMMRDSHRLTQEKKALEASLADLVVENYALQEQVDISCTEIELLQAQARAQQAPQQPADAGKSALSANGPSQVAYSVSQMASLWPAEEDASSASRSFSATRASFVSRIDRSASRPFAPGRGLSQTDSRLQQAAQTGEKPINQRRKACTSSETPGVYFPLNVALLRAVGLQSKEGEVRINGKKLQKVGTAKKVVLVARLARVVRRPHFFALVCQDSSGSMELYSQAATTDWVPDEAVAAPRLERYYRLQLAAKKGPEGCVFVVDRAELVTNLNLVTNHLLSVAHASLSTYCDLPSC